MHDHDRDATYDIVQRALAVGDPAAVDVAMLAGTYQTRVGTIRRRLDEIRSAWTGPVLAAVQHLGDDDTVGRFRMLQTPWNAHMQGTAQEWADGLREVALSRSTEDALRRAEPLEQLPGAGDFLLPQLMHLLHPGWFAVTNRASNRFWSQMGYEIGGLARLEAISKRYRDVLKENDLDFRIIDDLFSD